MPPLRSQTKHTAVPTTENGDTLLIHCPYCGSGTLTGKPTPNSDTICPCAGKNCHAVHYLQTATTTLPWRIRLRARLQKRCPLCIDVLPRNH